MILTKIKKFLGVLKDETCKTKDSKPVTFKNITKIGGGDGDTIVVKNGKKNCLIQCWNCKKETWVLRGSRCYRTGLCSRCLIKGMR